MRPWTTRPETDGIICLASDLRLSSEGDLFYMSSESEWKQD